jgi:hypothetical protein
MKLNYKIIISILTVFFLLVNSLNNNIYAQVPDWEWAKEGAGENYDYGLTVSTDNADQVYICGYFNSPTITFGNTTLTNAFPNQREAFIVKYDAAGNVIWANSFSGGQGEIITSCVNDNVGNLYVTGYYGSTSIVLGTDTLSNSGSFDAFIIKYSPSGNVLWAKSAGNNAFDMGSSIAIDDAGHIYVTGFYESSPISFDGFTLPNAGSYDLFVVKLDTLGNTMWAESIGSTGLESGSNIIFDNSGNFYLTGAFNSPSVIIGGIAYNNTSAGSNDVFLIKYNPNGTVLWTRTGGGTNNDGDHTATIDLEGNVYLTGTYSSLSIVFGTDTLINTGSKDIFIVKYDASGDIIWAKGEGSIGWENASGYTDNLGNYYLMGGFYDSASLILGTDTINCIDTTGYISVIFIARYDNLGNVMWIKSTEDPGASFIDLAFDNANNIYLTGVYGTSIDFGTTTLSNSGNQNLFVAKLNNLSVALEPQILKPINSFYPNPFNSLTVKQLNTAIQAGKLCIFNQYGQLVKEINNLCGSTISISRDNLPNGIYFIQVTEKGKIITTDKLIISN